MEMINHVQDVLGIQSLCHILIQACSGKLDKGVERFLCDDNGFFGV